MFAGNFAPRGWALCQGQIMSIAQNTALFSLLGTTYGGNGQTTFALPDLRGRTPIGTGQGPGLSPKVLGEVGGTETVTLIANQMPAHNHTIGASTSPGNIANPNGNTLAVGQVTVGGGTELVNMYASGTNPNVLLNVQTASIAGGSQPHDNMQPYLGMNFIIALVGIFPSRN
jgi:microcystin-dependent protein